MNYLLLCIFYVAGIAASREGELARLQQDALNFGDIELLANDQVDSNVYVDQKYAFLPMFAMRSGKSVPVRGESEVSLLDPNRTIQAVHHLASIALLTEEEDGQERSMLVENEVQDQCDAHLTASDYDKVILYIYVDFCQQESDQSTVQGWAVNLKNFLYDRYMLNGEVKFLGPESCEGSGDGYDSLATDFKTNDSNVNIGINIFRGGQQNAMHINNVKTMQENQSVFVAFEFYLCDVEQVCVTHMASNTAYISNIGDIVRYCRLRLVQKFVCKNVENAVPIEYYVQGQAKCACRCPPGYAKNEQNSCQPLENKCKCKWIQKCYKYQITSFWNDRECKIKNWYGNAGLVPIPFPHDNYVAFKKNQGDMTDGLSGPRIELQVNNTVQKYTWQYYENNRETIFNEIEIKRVGKYELTLRAYDYSEVPTECSTTLIVEDANPPSSAVACPSDPENAPAYSTDTLDYKYANYQEASTLINSYISWISARRNDACSHSPSDYTCDVKQYAASAFHESSPRTLSVVPNAKTCYQISTSDLNWMNLYIQTIGDSNKLPGNPNFCRKCCELGHRLGENRVKQHCNLPDDSMDCQLGEFCHVKKCLRASGTDFFSSDIHITPSLKNMSRDTIRQFPEEGYNYENEIHYSMPSNCTAPDDGENCKVRRPINTMYDVENAFMSNNVFDDIFNGNGMPDNLIKWRYKLETEEEWEWKLYDSGTDVTFKNYKTTIVFEAWSACGKIAEYTHYVYLHYHSPIQFQQRFGDSMFFQASRYHATRSDEEMSNYPDTNFGEITFDFNPNATFSNTGSGQLQYTFDKLDCTARVENSEEVAIIENYRTDQRLIKRFAVEFPNPTVPTFTTTFVCVFYYRDHENKTHTSVATRTVKFVDNDPPGMDCPWGECQLNCPSHLKRPNELCGGNQLRWDQLKGKTIYDTGDHECCQSCGNETTCDSMFPGIEEGTVHFCKMHDYFISVATANALLYKAPGGSSNASFFYSALVLSCVGVGAILALYRQRRHAKSYNLQDQYHSLL